MQNVNWRDHISNSGLYGDLPKVSDKVVWRTVSKARGAPCAPPQARSQDFSCVCVGGGGAYLKNRDQITNVGMIRHANFKDTRTMCPTYGLTEIGTTFNGNGKFCERQRREPLGRFGGHAPPENFQI